MQLDEFTKDELSVLQTLTQNYLAPSYTPVCDDNSVRSARTKIRIFFDTNFYGVNQNDNKTT